MLFLYFSFVFWQFCGIVQFDIFDILIFDLT